ncbi:type II secretion system protein [Hyphomonas oceanitis]|uniref:type IV pilus modification PilV family protein n=1 Tax=Hyphomonas oceanitis TaxID=81033 RepID=UPI003001452C
MPGTALPEVTDREAGFSLLETIAALAILSMAMVPLLALQFQLASGAAKLERQSELSRATSVARVTLSSLDIAGEPTGYRDLGAGWQLTWTSEPLGTQQPARYGLGIATRYRSQIYRVSANLVDRSNRATPLSLNVLGVVETTPYGGE